MKSILLSSITTIGLLSTFVTARAQEAVVRIGHVGAISGPSAHVGKDNENGVRMAIADANARALSIGGRKVRFELAAEDDAGDPKQATAAAQKLVDSRVNGVIGHTTSGTSIPASKIYAAAGLPQISAAATHPGYTRQGFKTTFRVVADDVQLGGALGRYAVTTLQGRSIAVIDDRTAYGQGVAEEFIKGVQAAGGRIVRREYTNDKATDFSAILTTLKGVKPDVIFYGGLDATAGPMLRQMRQLGLTARFVGGDGICSPELAKLAGDTMVDGQVLCAEAGGVDGTRKETLAKFRVDYRRRFGTDFQLYAPYAYDATMVMIDAMVAAGSADPATYLPALARTTRHDGVTGALTFDGKGDIRDGALTLYTYQNSQRDPIAVIR